MIHAIISGSLASMLPGELRKYALSLCGFDMYLMTMGNNNLSNYLSAFEHSIWKMRYINALLLLLLLIGLFTRLM